MAYVEEMGKLAKGEEEADLGWPLYIGCVKRAFGGRGMEGCFERMDNGVVGVVWGNELEGCFCVD